MKPIEFLINAEHHNEPYGAVMESLISKEMRIFSAPGKEWEVLSYYRGDDGCMVLDICEKPKA